MATATYTLDANDGWVEVAEPGEDFMIEMMSPGALRVTLQDSAPASDAPFHKLTYREVLVRTGTGAAYIRNPNATAPATVVVSV